MVAMIVLTLLAATPLARAQVSEPRVVLLNSSVTGRCGTGFYLNPSTVMTNRHVVDSICPQNVCKGLPESLGQVSVTATLSSLDIALLKVAEQPEATVVAFSEPRRDSEVRATGFPNCKERESRNGKVTGLRPLDITLDLKIDYGMSGSPILDAEGRVVGIVRQADSLGGALVGASIGGGFAARGSRGDVVQSLLTASARERCGMEASFITKQWSRLMDRLTGFERGLELLSLRESSLGLLSCADGDPSLARHLLLFLRRPHEFATAGFGESLDPVSWKLDLAALTSALTAYGAATIGAPSLPRTLEEELNSVVGTEERRSELKEVLGSLSHRDFYGAEFDILSSLGTSLLGIAFLIVIWAFSGGLVLRDAPGGVLRKVLVTVAVLLVFWPLSLAAYLFFRVRNNAKPPP